MSLHVGILSDANYKGEWTHTLLSYVVQNYYKLIQILSNLKQMTKQTKWREIIKIQ